MHSASDMQLQLNDVINQKKEKAEIVSLTHDGAGIGAVTDGADDDVDEARKRVKL